MEEDCATTEKEGDEIELKMNEDPEKVPELSCMEDLLSAAGTNGWRNYLIFFGCAWGSFVTPLHILSYQFLGATPNYWCHIPELVQANWTHEQILRLSTLKNTSNPYIQSCKMLDLNYTLASEIGFEKSLQYFEDYNPTHSLVSCDHRDFDPNAPLTVVSKWDLVCDRRVIYSSTQSSIFAGSLLGYLCVGYLSDLLGRKVVYVSSALTFLLFGILAAFSTNVVMYITLKIIISITTSSFYMVGIILVLELCSKNQRSYVGALFALPWAFGYMVLPGIAYFIRSFFYLQIAITLPILTLFPIFCILPESPRWLVLKGKFDEALLILEGISNHNKRELPSKLEIFTLMSTICEKQKIGVRSSAKFLIQIKKTFYKLYKMWTIKKWRLRLPVLFFGWFACSLVYYGVSLNPPDLRTGKYLYMFLGGVLEVPAYLMLWPANKYIGRKKCMVLLFFSCAVSILGTLFVSLQKNTDESGNMLQSFYVWLLVLSLIGKFAITAAFQLLWIFSIELIPTEFRSVILGEASVCGKFGSFFSPYIVDLLREAKEWVPSAIFGGVSLIAGCLMVFLPETRDQNLAESTEKTEIISKKVQEDQ
ncbi:UNVERIFIED_CONTAM: hypothetical protein RMT77_017260 [Armadillidium vulgare]